MLGCNDVEVVVGHKVVVVVVVSMQVAVASMVFADVVSRQVAVASMVFVDVVVVEDMRILQGMVDVVVGNGFADCENLLLLPLFRVLELLAEQKRFLKILKIN